MLLLWYFSFYSTLATVFHGLQGKVIGFYDSWPAKRIFPVDMAGFAVNIEYYLKHPDASMPYKAGYEEDLFLRSLNLTLDDIEPRADGCTQVHKFTSCISY